MKKMFLLLLIAIIAYVVFVLINGDSNTNVSQSIVVINQPQTNEPINEEDNRIFKPPLKGASERVTKKEFGILITPATSPIQPERFQGYHTGTDFEIFPEELNQGVIVQAVCTGNLIKKNEVNGYGGVAVQACKFNEEPITVVYGHLKLSSINVGPGEEIGSGEIIGSLGADKSVETGGERKHLHLGIHKGSKVNLLGYVGSEPELSSWVDPCLYVCYDN